MNLTQKLNEKAAKTAGQGGYQRNPDDPVMKSAVKDAERFLQTLPGDMKEPSVWSGSAKRPDIILSVSWWIHGYAHLKFVTVRFFGEGRWDASWDVPEHDEKQEASGSTINELETLKVAEKVKYLDVKSHATAARTLAAQFRL